MIEIFFLVRFTMALNDGSQRSLRITCAMISSPSSIPEKRRCYSLDRLREISWAGRRNSIGFPGCTQDVSWTLDLSGYEGGHHAPSEKARMAGVAILGTGVSRLGAGFISVLQSC